MANPEHLAKLKEGVEVWNQWRKEHPEIEPDLESVNFKDSDLEGINLQGANLKDSKLNCRLSFSDLTGANLKNTNFLHAYLKKARLTEAYAEGARFEQAYLSRADLSSAYFYKADFRGADLYYANLANSDLERALFTGASFEGANLYSANLQFVRALNADFFNSTLSGACIEDWHINKFTNFKRVKCDCIYLKREMSLLKLTLIDCYWNNPDTIPPPRELTRKYLECLEYGDRRPHDRSKNFASGEFTKLFQKAFETIDLLFQNGLDWEAFAYSLDNVQVLNKDIPLTIQKIENKGYGDVMISVIVPENADKGKIEGDFWQGYEFAKKQLEEQFKARIEDKNQEINRLFYMVNEQRKLIGDRNINVNGNYNEEIQGNNYQTENAGIVHSENSTISDNAKIAGINNEATPQDLAQAAEEIQQLLDQLQQTNGVTLETAQQQTAKDLATKANNDPQFKDKLINLSKFVGENSAKTLIGEGVKGVLKLLLFML